MFDEAFSESAKTGFSLSPEAPWPLSRAGSRQSTPLTSPCWSPRTLSPMLSPIPSPSAQSAAMAGSSSIKVEYLHPERASIYSLPSFHQSLSPTQSINPKDLAIDFSGMMDQSQFTPLLPPPPFLQTYEREDVKPPPESMEDANFVLSVEPPEEMLGSTPDMMTRRQFTKLEDAKFICKLCQKGFKRHGNYKAHQIVHDNNRDAKIECIKCTKSFRRRTDLMRHVRGVRLFNATSLIRRNADS